MAATRPNAHDRLEQAALDLFRERGYDRTTAAEIAERAGVTERTFFRYFADKREVMFDGEARLREALTASVARAPDGLGALAVLLRAFQSLVPMLEDRQAYAAPRQEVISATPALRERELAKIDALAEALAEALEARGVPALRAGLAARTGMAAFTDAALAWLADPSAGVGERIDRAFGELRALLAEGE